MGECLCMCEALCGGKKSDSRNRIVGTGDAHDRRTDKNEAARDARVVTRTSPFHLLSPFRILLQDDDDADDDVDSTASSLPLRSYKATSNTQEHPHNIKDNLLSLAIMSRKSTPRMDVLVTLLPSVALTVWRKRTSLDEPSLMLHPARDGDVLVRRTSSTSVMTAA